MPPEVQGLVDSLLHNPAKVAVNPISSPVEVIDQKLYYVDRGNKTRLLAALIRELDVKTPGVYPHQARGQQGGRDLVKAGISAAAIHGNKSQTARQQALADFKSGAVQVLVATDIAARAWT
ncbi:MAG: helicase-related protein [Flavonifractor plautii]